MKAYEFFDPELLGRAKSRKKRRVCFACTKDGYSVRNVDPFLCIWCGFKGHLKFNPKDLKNYKKPGRRAWLVCKDCATRYKKVRHRLDANGSFRCTCTGAGKFQHHLPNNKKCLLYPRFANDSRWPGKNKGVSQEDFHFYENVAKQQKL